MPEQQLLLKFEYISLFEYFSFLAGEGAFNWALEHGFGGCLLYTSPSPRDLSTSRMPSSA